MGGPEIWSKSNSRDPTSAMPSVFPGAPPLVSSKTWILQAWVSKPVHTLSRSVRRIAAARRKLFRLTRFDLISKEALVDNQWELLRLRRTARHCRQQLQSADMSTRQIYASRRLPCSSMA